MKKEFITSNISNEKVRNWSGADKWRKFGAFRYFYNRYKSNNHKSNDYFCNDYKSNNYVCNDLQPGEPASSPEVKVQIAAGRAPRNFFLFSSFPKSI